MKVVRSQAAFTSDSLPFCTVYIEGVIWPLAGVSEGIIELDPQSSLGNSPESLEILSQIDATIHTEHITIISRDGGEQKFNPNILGNITLDTS